LIIKPGSKYAVIARASVSSFVELTMFEAIVTAQKPSWSQGSRYPATFCISGCIKCSAHMDYGKKDQSMGSPAMHIPKISSTCDNVVYVED
jgi:hypothetical protein